MSTAIAWIEGQWGTAASLELPLNDRALLLADGRGSGRASRVRPAEALRYE